MALPMVMTMRGAAHGARRWWGACAGFALLWGCGGGVAVGAAADSPLTVHGARSAGCGVGTAASGWVRAGTVDGDGTPRHYRIEVPGRYDGSRPYPLIFVFHAAGGTAAESISWGLQDVADAAGNAIFVFPDGIPYRDQGIGWDSAPGGRDFPFFDNMLRTVGAVYCIDSGQVFAAGFSWGADFVTALACQRGDRLRAVAANSTTDEYRDTADYLTYQSLPCASRTHPAVRFEHAVDGDPAYPAPDFATTSHLFRYLNACGTTATRVATSTPVKACVVYAGCAAAYVECWFDRRIGHALPPNWAKDTWEFFAGMQTPRPGSPARIAP